MSPGSHKTDYVILAVLAVAAAAVLAVFVAWGWVGQDEEDMGIPSTHSTRPRGAQAWYMLLDRLGMPMRRSEQPLLEDNLAEVDVLVVIDPLFPFSGGELSAIRKWVADGGVLICTSAGCDPLRDLHGLSRTSRSWSDSYLSEGRSLSRSTRIPPGPRRPLQREVSRICLATQECVRFDQEGEVLPLLSDEEGARIAARCVGAGMVVVLADASFLTNRLLAQADNAVLASNLAAYALTVSRGRRLVYDEYHFGYETRQTGWMVLAAALVGTGPGWAVLALTLAGLLYLMYKGRRFGTRLAPERARRRSKLEFVHSVGATYRASGAHRMTLAIIYGWFRRCCAEAAGLHPSASAEQLVDALARRKGVRAGRWQVVLVDCQRALRQPALSARRVAALIAELAQLEAEMRDGHRQSK